MRTSGCGEDIKGGEGIFHVSRVMIADEEESETDAQTQASYPAPFTLLVYKF